MTPENHLRRALERGENVFGATAVTFSPTVVETIGGLGLDYVWLDLEHGGPSADDSTVFEGLTRAAEVGDVELLVRIPGPDPWVVRKVLDAGVRTILVPRIETAAEVHQTVAAAHFEYDGAPGDRGIGVGRSSRWGDDLNAYVDREDDEVLVGAMIENDQAVKNIEEILAVPKLGFTFVGPADLSVSLGRPLEKTHPDVQAAIERAREESLDAGVPIGCIQNDPTDATAALKRGYQILRIGGDIGAVRKVLSSRLDAIDP